MKRAMIKASRAVDRTHWRRTVRASLMDSVSHQHPHITPVKSFSTDSESSLPPFPSSTTSTTSTSTRGYQSPDQDDFRMFLLQDASDNHTAARDLLEAPIGSMTPEYWLDANSILRWWSIQRTRESVDMSFQLMERMLKERMTLPQVAVNSDDNDDDENSISYREWLNADMLNRMINNWRVIWWEQQQQQKDCDMPESQSNLMTPRMILDLVERYYSEYGFPMNEKSFYLILEAELTHPGGDYEETSMESNNKMRYTTPEMANAMIDRCIELHEKDGLPGCLPSTDLFNLAMRVWNVSGRTKDAPAQCEALYNRMIQYNIPTNTRTFSGILHAWARTGSRLGVQKAHEWLYQMHSHYMEGDDTLKPDHVAIATVIAAWSRSGAPDAAEQALELYRHLGSLVLYNRIHIFNSLLTCYSKTRREKDVRQAERLFYELLNHDRDDKNAEDPKPNATTYLILISAFARVGRPEKAEALLREMENEYAKGHDDLKPTYLHYNAVVSAFAQSERSDNLDRMKAIMKRMEDVSRKLGDDSLMPTLSTYNAFLACFAHSKISFAGSKSEQILLELKARADAGDLRYVPDRVTYTTVINVYAKYGLVKEAIRVLENMYRDFCDGNKTAQPDLHTYNTVLGAFAKVKKAANAGDQALQFFERMKTLAANGVIESPDLVSYSTLIHAFASANGKNKIANAQRAESILRELQTASASDEMLRPNCIVYNNCMNAWASAGSSDRVSDLLREMYLDYQGGNSKACPDVVSFNTLIKAFANERRSDSGEKAEAIVERMKDLHKSGELNVRPTCVTYTTMIYCHLNSNRPGSLERAEEILQLMDQLYEAGELEQTASKETFDRIRRKWDKSWSPERFERSDRLRNEIKARFAT